MAKVSPYREGHRVRKPRSMATKIPRSWHVQKGKSVAWSFNRNIPYTGIFRELRKVALQLLNGLRYSTQTSGTNLTTSTLLRERPPDKPVVTVSKNTKGFWFPNGQQLCLTWKWPRGVIGSLSPRPYLTTKFFCVPQMRLLCWLS